MQYKLWNLSIDRKFYVIFPKNLMKFHVWTPLNTRYEWIILTLASSKFWTCEFLMKNTFGMTQCTVFYTGSFEILHQKHMFFGQNWTKVTSRRNILLIRGQILYLNLAHVFNHVFLQKSPQRKISWLPKILKILSKIISSSI